ncbi:MAG: GNAT family N-acetyltransferase [Alphaproteobacteria bacterium]
MSEAPNRVVITEERMHPDNRHYLWLLIDADGERVGKARIERQYRRTIIRTINIYEEYQHHHYAQLAVETLKDKSYEIIADRVRHTAAGFWQKMGFYPGGDDCYIWRADGKYS